MNQTKTTAIIEESPEKLKQITEKLKSPKPRRKKKIEETTDKYKRSNGTRIQ